MTTTMRNTIAADARRKALRAWIDTRFAGSQAAYIRDAKRRGVALSQSEISQLLGTKSFGENKAETLEQQSGMPAGYLVRASSDSSRVQESPAPAHQIPTATADVTASLAAILAEVPETLRPAVGKLLESMASAPADKALQTSLASLLDSTRKRA